MIHYRIQDVIAWNDLPNPPQDIPGESSFRLNVQVRPAFWQHVREHARDQRGPWDRFLSPRDVDALIDLPRTPTLPDPELRQPRLRRMAAQAKPFDPDAQVPSRTDLLPPRVPQLIHQALSDSLQHGLILSEAATDRPAAASACPAGDWRVLSPDGLVMVIQWRQDVGELSDCYFAHGAAGLGEDWAAEDVDAPRRAAIRQMLVRHARYDRDRDVFLAEPAGSERPVSFACPHAWGFGRDDGGSRWTGFGFPGDLRKLPRAALLVQRIADAQLVAPIMFKRAGIAAHAKEDPLFRPRHWPPGEQGTARDPLHYGAELAAARRSLRLMDLEQGQPADPGVRQAAYRLAAAMGRCETLAADVPDMRIALRPVLARQAGLALQERLLRWTAQAGDLPARLDSATAAYAQEICLGLLESRMEAWGVYLVLDEAFSAALEHGEQDLTAIVDGVLDAMEAFDRALERNIPILAAHARPSHLLDNWRGLLAESFRDLCPWWLDGTLDRAPAR